MILSILRFLDILSILFLWTQICSYLCLAAGQNVPSKSYATGIYRIIPHELNSSQSGDSRFFFGGNVHMVSDLDITWVNSSMSSITIQWSLTKDDTQTNILGSEVECFVEGGRFVSKMLLPEINQFTFQNLQVANTYTVCVRVFEQERTRDISSVTHSKCIQLKTLDYIRKDSILWLLMTLGYYLFMGLLGYTQWRRKLCEISKRSNGRNTNTAHNANDDVRWRDLEERERLMQPGCSIEANK